MVYKTKGTCSQAINVELDGDVIKHVEFVGGCSGNTQGVAKLVEGMKAEEAISAGEGTETGTGTVNIAKEEVPACTSSFLLFRHALEAGECLSAFKSGTAPCSVP